MNLPNERIKLFVTIGQRLYRDAVMFELVHQKHIDLVGEAENGTDTLDLIDRVNTSSLVIEEALPDIDGLTVAEMALTRNPALSIILLVDRPVSDHRLAIYLDAGIKSVVSKNRSLDYLSKVINYTGNGQRFVDVNEKATNVASTQHIAILLEDFDHGRYLSLSEREQQVAERIADHASLSDIANHLKISNKTIHTYKERILVKLGCQKLNELVVYMKRLRFYQTIDRGGL